MNDIVGNESLLTLTYYDGTPLAKFQHNTDSSMELRVGNATGFMTSNQRVELLHWLWGHATEDERPR